MATDIYVSITGLRLKRFWHRPVFWRLARASMEQALRTEGCLIADARTINRVHHTRSAWSSRAAMLAFLHNGAHLEALRAFRRIATGKTFGAPMAELPDWPEVHEIWCEYGRQY